MPADPQSARSTASAPPLVTAVDMGYGHLRAAHALAAALGTEVARADRAPLANPAEVHLWRAARAGYEAASRGSQRGALQPLLRPALEALTRIGPLDGPEAANGHARPPAVLTALLSRGIGAGPAEAAARAGVPLLATYFVPPLAADRLADRDRPPASWCVVTDTDLARAWVAAEPGASAVRYLAPSRRAEQRLLHYGVPAERVTFTGFPLPGELLGGPELPVLRRNLEARLGRLDRSGGDGGGREPVHLVFTVGGAGAQAEIARTILDGLRPLIEAGELRLTLVAGVRKEVAERFREWTQRSGLEGAVPVLVEPTPAAYFRAFDTLLADADLLWTKPSELTFFAALGLPLLLAPPVGAHERYNREWLLENGAALRPDREAIGPWLRARLADGSFARAARAGAERLPKRGLHRIVERVTGGA